jgi:hypothetical protein
MGKLAYAGVTRYPVAQTHYVLMDFGYMPGDSGEIHLNNRCR